MKAAVESVDAKQLDGLVLVYIHGKNKCRDSYDGGEESQDFKQIGLATNIDVAKYHWADNRVSLVSVIDVFDAVLSQKQQDEVKKREKKAQLKLLGNELGYGLTPLDSIEEEMKQGDNFVTDTLNYQLWLVTLTGYPRGWNPDYREMFKYDTDVLLASSNDIKQWLLSHPQWQAEVLFDSKNIHRAGTEQMIHLIDQYQMKIANHQHEINKHSHMISILKNLLPS